MTTLLVDESKAKEVLRQVEFYFSDSNLPRDNFLRKTVQESDDGLVSLALICSFGRMRSHLALGALKPDEVPEETLSAVADVLRKSASLKLSEDGKRVGRITELSKLEDVMEQVDSRTISASPLPYNIQIQDLEFFFGQHGKVNSVRLPRHVADKRQFCGTALIEYAEDAVAMKVVNEKLIYEGAELELKPKKDFDNRRNIQRDEVEKNRSSKSDAPNGYRKGLIIAFNLNKSTGGAVEQIGLEKVDCSDDISNPTVSKSGEVLNENDEDNARENDNINNISSEGFDNDNGRKIAESEAADTIGTDAPEERKTAEVNSERNNAPSADDKDIVTREDLRALFQGFGNVKYVDYRMGEESGYIRFENPEAALKARAMAVVVGEGGLVVKNHYVTLEALTGEAEKEYWSLVRENQERHWDNKSQRGRGGRHNRGGRQFDGKRSRQDNPSEGRPNKVQKN